MLVDANKYFTNIKEIQKALIKTLKHLLRVKATIATFDHRLHNQTLYKCDERWIFIFTSMHIKESNFTTLQQRKVVIIAN